MKKKSISFVITALVLLTVMVIFSCEDDPPPSGTTTFAVTVNSAGTGSTGSGNYAKGATVNINAGIAPAGKFFINWTTQSAGVNFTNSSAASTSFSMPGNTVTVTANFGDNPPVGNPVTIDSAGSGFSGGGNYIQGATVTINAGTPPAGERFINWETESAGVNFANEKNSITTFQMPGHAVTVKANFGGDTYLKTIFSPSGKPYIMRVNGHTSDDAQLPFSTTEFLSFVDGTTYILDFNVKVIPSENPAHDSNVNVLRVRIHNEQNTIYWANGILLSTPALWASFDGPSNRPTFNETEAENVITSLTGEYAGWENIKMKFIRPTRGDTVCHWQGNGWYIKDDWSIVSASDHSQPATNNGQGWLVPVVPHDDIRPHLANWNVQLQIRPNGKNYLLDNMRLYPEGNEAGDLLKPFNEWPTEGSYDSTRVTIYNGAPNDNAWLVIPTMNGNE